MARALDGVGLWGAVSGAQAAFLLSGAACVCAARLRRWAAGCVEDRCLLARVGTEALKSLAGVRQSQSVETATGMLHCLRVDGRGGPDAPSLVLVHGLASSMVDFATLVTALQARKRTKQLILMDLPGHGLSPAALDETHAQTMQQIITLHCHAVRDCMRAMLSEDDRVVVVGHSLGGRVTSELVEHLDDDGDAGSDGSETIKHGATHQALKGIVLLAPAGGPVDLDHVKNIHRIFRDDPSLLALGSVRADSWLFPFARALFSVVAPYRTSRKAVQHTVDLLRPGDGMAESKAQQTSTPATPVLFVWGENEEILASHQLDWWREHLPKDRTDLKVFSHLGHLPHVEDVSLIADCVCDFLTKLNL